MDDTQLNTLVDAIVRELKSSGAVKPASTAGTSASASSTLSAPSATSSKPQFSTPPISNSLISKNAGSEFAKTPNPIFPSGVNDAY